MKIKGLKDTINWYNKNAKKYSDTTQNLAAVYQIKDFVKLVPKNTKILDAGCASGRDAKLFSDMGIETIGIDLSSELIKLAKIKHPYIEFIEGNFINLPFENETFGGVWARASLLHLETTDDVKKSLSEFYRVLIKGGVLLVSVKEQTGKDKFAVIKDKLSKHNRFFQFFTKPEIKGLLENSGFNVIKIENTEDPAGRKEVKWILCLASKNIV